MTRVADERKVLCPDLELSECARCYRAYLPNPSQRLHPYAAPLESRRLAGLPPALIASAEHDLLLIEAENYAAELIAAGVPTEVTRHCQASHQALAAHERRHRQEDEPALRAVPAPPLGGARLLEGGVAAGDHRVVGGELREQPGDVQLGQPAQQREVGVV